MERVGSLQKRHVENTGSLEKDLYRKDREPTKKTVLVLEGIELYEHLQPEGSCFHPMGAA